MTGASDQREGDSHWTVLSRRKVVQWGLGYAAAAWTLLQVIEFLGETYGWPPAVRQIATLVLPLGALPVLVLAWYHGDKGEQKVTRPELAILVALLLTLGALLWWYVSQMDETAWIPDKGLPEIKRVTPTEAPSVAVLPFVNMSSDPEQEYFSDGLSEEILNALAGVPGLYVPARTSSFQFKGKTGDVAAFAARLGVAAVLEGSVRKSGRRIRVTAQLVNAADGFHLWSETFDRDLTDVFDIQAEIANHIVEALRVKLKPGREHAVAAEVLTGNPEAYEAYLLGRHALQKGQAESVAKAVEHFRTAVDLDAEFAVAHASLAVALVKDSHSRAGMKWTDERNAALAKARAALNRAQAMAPGHAEVLAAAGFLDRAEGNARREGLERALANFERSLAVNPSNGQVLTWRNQTLRGLGQYDRLLQASYDALKRDPLSLDALVFRIDVLLQFGRRAEAGPLVERVRSLDEARGQLWLAELAEHDGDRPGAIRHCMAAVSLGSSPMCGWFQFAALDMKAETLVHAGNPAAGHWTLGEFEEAVRLAREGYEEDAAWWQTDLVIWYWTIGDFANSWDFFERTRRDVESGSQYGGWFFDPMFLLAAADSARKLGRPAEAARLHEQASERVHALVRAAEPFESDSNLDLAMLAAYAGRDDEAASYLIKLIRSGWYWHIVMRAPLFKQIVQREDFRAALREQQAVMDRQRREIVEILCGPTPPPEKFAPQPETCRGYRAGSPPSARADR